MLVQSKTICMGMKLNIYCSVVCQVITKYTRDFFSKSFKSFSYHFGSCYSQAATNACAEKGVLSQP